MFSKKRNAWHAACPKTSVGLVEVVVYKTHQMMEQFDTSLNRFVSVAVLNKKSAAQFADPVKRIDSRVEQEAADHLIDRSYLLLFLKTLERFLPKRLFCHSQITNKKCPLSSCMFVCNLSETISTNSKDQSTKNAPRRATRLFVGQKSLERNVLFGSTRIRRGIRIRGSIGIVGCVSILSIARGFVR